MTLQCPHCNKFVTLNTLVITKRLDVLKVTGDCVKCGEVVITRWAYEEIVPDRAKKLYKVK